MKLKNPRPYEEVCSFLNHWKYLLVCLINFIDLQISTTAFYDPGYI